MGISRQYLSVFDADTGLAAPAFAYVDFGVSRGLSRDKLMAAAGLTAEMRADPDARCPIVAFIVLWRELMMGLPGVALPVELARALDISVLGVTAQIAVRGDTVGHATELVDRFMKLTDTAGGVVRLERDGRVGFQITHRPEVVAMRFPIEVMLGVAARVMQDAMAGALPVREVTFAHPNAYPAELYAEAFGAPVRFSADVSALWLDADAFDLPLPGRDPVARRYLEAHAQHMLAAIPEPLTDEVKRAILVELAPSGAELARVAARVAMSPRTLQRRLEEQGRTYQDLVEDVRAAMAKALLADRARSIVDVAFELGYADLKGFYRAFRRWTDTTPAEWRRGNIVSNP